MIDVLEAGEAASTDGGLTALDRDHSLPRAAFRGVPEREHCTEDLAQRRSRAEQNRAEQVESPFYVQPKVQLGRGA